MRYDIPGPCVFRARAEKIRGKSSPSETPSVGNYCLQVLLFCVKLSTCGAVDQTRRLGNLRRGKEGTSYKNLPLSPKTSGLTAVKPLEYGTMRGRVCRNRQFLENSAHTNPETPGSRARSELPCGHGISRNYPLGRRQWCHVGRRRHVSLSCLTPPGDGQLSPSPGRQTSASDDVILLFLIPAVRQGDKYMVFVCVPFFLHSLQSHL